jgi:polar amino acid transport system substrate-binding protein
VRLRNLGAVVLTGTLLAACGSSTKSSSAAAFGNCKVTAGKRSTIKLKPVKAGVLSVQTSLPATGWFNGDDAASVKDGYEYCMAAEIANRAGLDKVELSNVDFDQLVSAGTKDFDIALAEISITDKRKQVVDFSTPYFASDIGVLTSKDSKIASTADLKKAKLGVQKGTTGADFALASINKDAKVFEDTASMFTALSSGDIDAAMTDTSIVQQQEKQSNGALKVVGQYKTGESYGALYPKGSANEAAMDTAIKALISEKVLNTFATTYLSGDPSTVPFFTA